MANKKRRRVGNLEFNILYPKGVFKMSSSKKRDREEFHENLINAIDNIREAIADQECTNGGDIACLSREMSTANTHLCNTLYDLNKTMKGIESQLKRIADGIVKNE